MYVCKTYLAYLFRGHKILSASKILVRTWHICDRERQKAIAPITMETVELNKSLASLGLVSRASRELSYIKRGRGVARIL